MMKFFRVLLISCFFSAGFCRGEELRIADATGGAPLGFLLQSSAMLAFEGKTGVKMQRFLPSKALQALKNRQLDAVILDRKFVPGGMRQIPFAAEALVLYVSSANAGAELSSRQVWEILSAPMPDWRRYNKLYLDIQRIMVKLSAPSGTLIRRIFGDREVDSGVFQVESLSSGFSFINPASIFFAPFIPVLPERVKMLPVDGVMPDSGNIVSGKYPLSRQYVIAFQRRTPALNRLLQIINKQNLRRDLSEAGMILLLPPLIPEEQK